MEVNPDTNGTGDEFNSTLKKIIEKQSDLEKVRNEFKKENELLTNNLCSIKQKNEELRIEKENLKLLVLREQDDFDHVNARLNNEILTIKDLFENVDNASKLANDFIKKNSIVASFFNGISSNYNELQDSINNLALKITQENMHIKDKVTTSKLYKEKYQTDLQNDIIQCEMDLDNICNAVSCMKKAIFEKQLQLSKLSVTADYVCEEELKDKLNLENLEKKLKELTNDGRNCIEEEQSAIYDLEKREETLRNTLKELENDEEILRQSINVVQQNLINLENSYRDRELEEKSCSEKLLLLNDAVDNLVKMKSSIENDLQVKENLNQDNERMRSAVLNLENKFKELIAEKGDIESDIEYLQNDMKEYLAEIESEKRNQLEEIAAQEKIQSDICSMNEKSNESSEKHYQNVNLLKEEIENLKQSLNETENALLQIQASNAHKAQQVHNYESDLQNCRNDIATLMEKLQIETNRVEEYEKSIADNQKIFAASLEEITTTLMMKKEELRAEEKNADRISSLKQKIGQVKSELSKQIEQNQSDLQQIENDNLYCKNDVEERFETLKIQLENKNKKLQTELLEYQTGLTELENMEQKLKISIAAIKDEVENVKNKSIQLMKTRNFLNSKVSKARKNLRSAIDDNKSDDVSVSQLSIDRSKRQIDNQDEDSDESSSGISTSDPRWVVPKNKSGNSSSSVGERSQKK